MRICVCGSRGISKQAVLKAIRESKFEITEIVCGGARGADAYGKAYGECFGIPVKMFPADWKRHGKKAGMLRNAQMFEYCDGLIVVWDGDSPGTRNMIERAFAGGKPHEIWVSGVVSRY